MTTTGSPNTSRPTDSITSYPFKPDFPAAATHHLQWWRRDGLVLNVTAPLPSPRIDITQPTPPDDVRQRWLDPAYRARRAEYRAATTHYAADSLPAPHCLVGAGDLGAFLGCEYGFAESTCWFEPCINDPADCLAITFDPQNPNFRAIHDLLAECKRLAADRYIVGLPDLVENFDILSAMRDPQTLLTDTYDCPDWVIDRIDEINTAYFEVYDRFAELLRLPDGSICFEAFGLWGPGRVAKVQCDAAAMLSPDMFRRFVSPALTRQCDWLDGSMYHLDGEDALPCLEPLLEIEPLDAIEWTPRYLYAGDSGGNPKWHDLYRRILKAGKSVQAIGVKYDEVIPLLDAVGAQGMYIVTTAETPEAADQLAERADAYR